MEWIYEQRKELVFWQLQDRVVLLDRVLLMYTNGVRFSLVIVSTHTKLWLFPYKSNMPYFINLCYNQWASTHDLRQSISDKDTKHVKVFSTSHQHNVSTLLMAKWSLTKTVFYFKLFTFITTSSDTINCCRDETCEFKKGENSRQIFVLFSLLILLLDGSPR